MAWHHCYILPRPVSVKESTSMTFQLEIVETALSSILWLVEHHQVLRCGASHRLKKRHNACVCALFIRNQPISRPPKPRDTAGDKKRRHRERRERQRETWKDREAQRNAAEDRPTGEQTQGRGGGAGDIPQRPRHRSSSCAASATRPLAPSSEKA